MKTKRQRFQNVFFQLVVFGRWQLFAGNNEFIVLRQEPKQLYDSQKGEIVNVVAGFLYIYPNGTYKSSTKISLYDIEVLESNRFKIIA